ncbi:hypothetical protein PR202_ga20051 [Eleusine coracana subsp. coracana]|uniref:Uncharacterized protein n=1 Tax=Eleusine coracana subsp. coracana TaxID=191504 RepID=A0AAV5CX68_ELECO|nr:hypothetical protein PR202_ga20051 [Eleusine coracana subsp. coracana]
MATAPPPFSVAQLKVVFSLKFASPSARGRGSASPSARVPAEIRLPVLRLPVLCLLEASSRRQELQIRPRDATR